jgi:hypothetical protein
MKPIIHTLKCNIVIEPEKKDRFFMDMSVYEVVPHELVVDNGGTRSLLWRGIYLAIEVSSTARIGNGPT